VEIWFQYARAIAGDVIRTDTLFARLAGAGSAVWFYIYKMLLPVSLSFIYPRWHIDPRNLLSYVPDIALLGLLVLCWLYRRSWGRPVLFALAYYIVMLLPVLGFFNIYFMKYSLVADHYQYVSIIGVIALLVAAGHRIAARFGRQQASTARIVAAFVLLVFGALSWHRSCIYKNPETLWSDTFHKNPYAWLASNNLGFIRQSQGKLDEAISYYLRTLQIASDCAEAHSNLGNALLEKGKIDEAISHHRQALQVKPNSAEMQNNLGYALQSKGNLDEAIICYRQALQIKPNFAEVIYNLGNALNSQNKPDEAIHHYRQALQLKPDYAEAHNNLGNVLKSQGKLDEAISHFRQALLAKPDFVDAHFNLANALSSQHRLDEAISHYRQALQAKPDFAKAHNNLGAALQLQGNLDEAVANYLDALQAEPNYVEAHNNMGYALQLQGKFDEAVSHYRRALQIDPNNTKAGRALQALLKNTSSAPGR